MNIKIKQHFRKVYRDYTLVGKKNTSSEFIGGPMAGLLCLLDDIFIKSHENAPVYPSLAIAILCNEPIKQVYTVEGTLKVPGYFDYLYRHEIHDNMCRLQNVEEFFRTELPKSGN